MRKLVAMAMIGASAVIFSASAPAQAMTAGSAGVAKAAAAAPGEATVHEVRRKWKRRHYRKWRHRHRHYGHRRYYRHRYRPYYYGGYYGYPYRYRRPRAGIYFRF